MKNTILLIGILVGILAISCHDITVGYLSTGECRDMIRIPWK